MSLTWCVQVDYNHPALGGCFGEGCLVAFGADFVGDEYTGDNEPIPDDDPMDCTRSGSSVAGHGTHVAGIIAAQPNELSFTGAAPDVILGAYRVLGCGGSSTNELLIAAYNQAFEDGADIITASLGRPSGWTEDPWSVVVSRIVDQGVPCTSSAGNVGQLGLFFPGSAANGKGVTAVASFENTELTNLLYLAEVIVDGAEPQEFGYAPGIPGFASDISLPLYAPDLDPAVPNGGCDPYPEDTPDLGGFIVLVRRGGCAFTQKGRYAADRGAQYIIIYNNFLGAEVFNIEGVGIQGSAMVASSVGEGWIELLASGAEVRLDIVATNTAETELVRGSNTQTGGAVSYFTSWGPTYGVDVKPQFGAPGGGILSTYPIALGQYAVISGTSMACPLVAAVYALLAEARGTLDPVLLGNLLSATANPQLFHDSIVFYNFLAPVPQQGSGLIQAYDAAYTTTLLEPQSLSFNDSANFIEVLNFTLSNIGDEEITYEISNVPTITMYTLEPNSIYPAWAPNEIANVYASLAFGEDSVTVPAGESLAVEVLPTPPQGLNASRLPVWSGYIAINGSDGSSFSLPYQGVSGSLYEATVLGPQDAWIARSTALDLTPVPGNTTFTLPPQGSTPIRGNYSLPRLTVQLAMGSPHVRADLVPLSTPLPDSVVDVWGTPSLGQPEGTPFRYVPRFWELTVDWYGKLGDGEYVPEGRYKIVFRALRITGDPDKEEDWDVAETAAFGIKYDAE